MSKLGQEKADYTIPWVSPTMVSMFKNDHNGFMLRYVHKQKTPKSDPMIKGIIADYLIKRALQERLKVEGDIELDWEELVDENGSLEPNRKLFFLERCEMVRDHYIQNTLPFWVPHCRNTVFEPMLMYRHTTPSGKTVALGGNPDFLITVPGPDGSVSVIIVDIKVTKNVGVRYQSYEEQASFYRTVCQLRNPAIIKFDSIIHCVNENDFKRHIIHAKNILDEINTFVDLAWDFIKKDGQ
jgi:hypothetical protein